MKKLSLIAFLRIIPTFRNSLSQALNAALFGVTQTAYMFKQDITHGSWTRYIKEGTKLFLKQKPLSFFSSIAVALVVALCVKKGYFEKGPIQNLILTKKTYATIIVPIIEELLFTGILNHILGKKYGPMLTPLIFGVTHLIEPILYKKNCVNWLLVAWQAGIMSYFNTRNTYATQSITPSIIHHMLNNGFGILLMALSQS